MEIKLTTEKEEPKVKLSNQRLDNSNFVELIIEKENGTEIECIEIDLSVNELMSAIGAFQQQRVMQAHQDNDWRD